MKPVGWETISWHTVSISTLNLFHLILIMEITSATSQLTVIFIVIKQIFKSLCKWRQGLLIGRVRSSVDFLENDNLMKIIKKLRL